MSLILDALKKSEAERADTDTPQAHLSSYDHESQPAQSSRVVVYVATIGIAVFGGIAGYGYLNMQNEPTPPAVMAEASPVVVNKPADTTEESGQVEEPDAIADDPVTVSDVPPEENMPEVETVGSETVEPPVNVPETADAAPLEPEETPKESPPVTVAMEQIPAEQVVPDEIAPEQVGPEQVVPEQVVTEQVEITAKPLVVQIEAEFEVLPPPTKPDAPPAPPPADAQTLADSTAKIDRGWAYLSDQDYPAAIATFRQAINSNPASPNAFYGLGWSYEKSNQTDLAIDSYSKAIAVDARHVNAIFSRGFLQFYDGQFERAGRDFRSIVEFEKGAMHDYACRGRS